MLDQLGIRLRDLSQIILLLVALLDQITVLLLGVRVLFVHISERFGQMGQDRSDVAFGVRSISDLGLERMEFDRVLRGKQGWSRQY